MFVLVDLLTIGIRATAFDNWEASFGLRCLSFLKLQWSFAWQDLSRQKIRFLFNVIAASRNAS